jgi:hypothetical protein
MNNGRSDQPDYDPQTEAKPPAGPVTDQMKSDADNLAQKVAQHDDQALQDAKKRKKADRKAAKATQKKR